jgi:hypothetical protein
MYVPIHGHSWQIVMFEGYALVAQRPHDVLDVVADRPL